MTSRPKHAGAALPVPHQRLARIAVVPSSMRDVDPGELQIVGQDDTRNDDPSDARIAHLACEEPRELLFQPFGHPRRFLALRQSSSLSVEIVADRNRLGRAAHVRTASSRKVLGGGARSARGRSRTRSPRRRRRSRPKDRTLVEILPVHLGDGGRRRRAGASRSLNLLVDDAPLLFQRDRACGMWNVSLRTPTNIALRALGAGEGREEERPPARPRGHQSRCFTSSIS